MKITRISLSAAALLVTIVGLFSFRGTASRGSNGTLYTIGGQNHVKCSRNLPGHNSCPVLAYTRGGTQIFGPFSTGD